MNHLTRFYLIHIVWLNVNIPQVFSEGEMERKELFN